MKTKHNIFKKIFLILCLIVGWGSVHAERFAPAYVSSQNLESDHWYYVRFHNNGNYLRAQEAGARIQHVSRAESAKQDPDYLWQLVGDDHYGFKFVSMTGVYAYWVNGTLTGTANGEEAAFFELQAGNDADSWGVKMFAGANNQFLNPQSGNVVKTWNNDNGSRVRFEAPAAVDLDAARHTVMGSMLGNNVRLLFLDGEGNTLSDANPYVKYTDAAGTIHVLSSANSHYDFGNVHYHPGAFSGYGSYFLSAVHFDPTEQLLTFTLTTDPNILSFSDAPANGQWADDTKWYTWRNNRPTGTSNPAHRYMSTSANFVNDDYHLTNSCADDGGNDRGGVWCFVGNESGFQIQNAAYGPDFVFAHLGGNNYGMVLKDDVPEGATTTFTYLACGDGLAASSYLDGATHGYVFRIGTTGNNQIHSNSTGLISWDGGGSLRNDDGGSVFKVTMVSAEQLEALTAYDVYRTHTLGVDADIAIDYTPLANTFGKRSSAKDGDILIIQHGSPYAVENFTVSDAAYVLGGVALHDDDTHTHAYKLLSLSLHDTQATQEFGIVVIDRTAAQNIDVDLVDVTYNGIAYRNGETIFTRPDALPQAIDFKVNMDDKFIWGPVIDREGKSVTFYIRDLATALTDGLYQLHLKNADNVTTVNTRIAKHVENINTRSQYIYMMPALSHAFANYPIKLSGVNNASQEPSTFITIKKGSGSNYTLSYDADYSLAVTGSFSNGVFTLMGAVSNDLSGQGDDPHEMPYINTSGSGTLEFYITPANIDDYYVYKLQFEGEADVNTTISCSQPVLNGVSALKDGDFLILPKGVMLAKSDFTPSNARVTALDIVVADPEHGVPYNILKIAMETVKNHWTCHITTPAGSGINVNDYKVVYGDQQYADGEVAILPMGTTPTAVDFKTNCSAHFVWGPVLNYDDRSVTFDIRPTVNSLDDLQSGLYQIQLYDEASLTTGTVEDTTPSVAKVNSRMADNTVNTPSSYIYVMPYSNYFSQADGRMLKYNGVPKYGSEVYSYVYITREGDKISIQQLDGKYPKDNEKVDGTPNTTKHTISTSNLIFSNPTDKNGQTAHLMGVKNWVIDDLWSSTTKSTSTNGPRVAYSNKGKALESYYLTRPDVTSKYKVYRVTGVGEQMVTYIGTAKNYINNTMHDGGFIFLDSFETLPASGAFACTTSYGDVSYTIGTAGADGIIPVTFTLGTALTNTVIHRQHAAYDFLESLDPELRPGEGFIQVGEGLDTKTLADGTKITVQHASNFEIDLYCNPGNSVTCLLPHTVNKGDAGGQMQSFQRWYDYDTELPITDLVAADTFSKYTTYTNGNVSISNGDFVSLVKVTLPTGTNQLNIACDCSDFGDGKALGTGDNANYLEPSLGYRVIFHIHSAKQMADDLKAKTAAGKYYEEKEFIVPNVKYGNDAHNNNGDLIPLDLAWSNYWMYAADGTTLTQLINENTSTGDGDFHNKRVIVEVDAASAAKGLKAQVLGSSTPTHGKIGGGNYGNSYVNHFILYYIDKEGTKREMPKDHVATITVKIKPSTAADAPVYNLAKYTLKYTANAEPLALPLVIGADAEHPISERSTDYFISQNYQQIASLTFQQKDVPYDKPRAMSSGGSHNVNLKDLCYAVPLEFDNASYGYSYVHQYAQYKVSRMSYGFKYNPVSLYEYNIKHPSSTLCDIKDDYYLYIDAAEQPGRVAVIPLEGNLCAGSRLYCYGWMGSTNSGLKVADSDRQTSGSASVVLNLIGRREDGTSKILASYLPGTLSNVVYDESGTAYRSLTYGRTFNTEQGHWLENTPPDAGASYPRFGAWQQIGFSTILNEVGFASYELEVINNCYTTGGGDYLLDDFTVFMNPPSAVVDFSTPVCSDEIEHIKIHTPFDLIEDAATTIIDGKEYYKVNYAFIDKKIYYDYFDEHCADADSYGRHPGDEGYVLTYRAFTQDDYNAAFNAALMGSGTDQYTEVDGVRTQAPSFWNVTVSTNYNDLETYHFATAVNSLEEGKSYSEEVAGERRVVMKRSMRPAEHWEPGRDYLIVFAKGWVDHDFDKAATEFYSLDHNCSFLADFTIKPAIIVNSDVEYTAADALMACDGQTASMSICMVGVGPDGEKFKDRMTYDWWIGYGFGSSNPDVPTTLENRGHVIPATVNNFLQLQYNGVKLHEALDHFRACYLYATTIEGCPPCEAPSMYGHTYDFTQGDYDCIAYFLRPNDLGRVPLILGSNAFNTRLELKDAVKELRAPGLDTSVEDNYDHNIYITIIPITPVSPYDKDDNVIYCPDPQQVKVRLFGNAPSMIDGFGALTYPEDLQSVPVRAGVKQIDATKMKAGVAKHFLRVPLRNVKTVNGANLDVLKYEDAGETLDYVYLSGSDDPHYTDSYISGVKDNILQFIPVGRVQVYSAKGESKEAYMEIAFSESFIPREGYTYTLKCRFAEEEVEGKVTPCPGSLFFDLKIVPEYQQWTATTATEYTNDNNWARSEYEVLHAGNVASDGTTPLAGYTTNAKNYEKDARYVAGQEKTAHGFTPMYFTNILMREPNCLAPVMKPTKAPAAYPYQTTTGNTTDDFLKGLSDNATKLIQYDMLVTPIDDDNKPLPLASRYVAHTGNYGCEPFWTNVCDGLTFEPGTMMYDAQYLTYNRAWVEYELDTKRWYTLASPLQSTYAGEWYSPEAGGRQLTPHFYPVTYNEALNDRFNPAYYQRSWDKAGHAWIYSMPGDDNAYLGFTTDKSPYSDNKRVTRPVLLNWGYVYNDVEVPYSQGGFSVNVRYTD